MWAQLLVGLAIASPDASRGWILIDLLEDVGWNFGCGDDHIPIIDCMKISCGEGQKRKKTWKEECVLGIQLSQR
jgi:hypothetical protein